jgi:ABC-type Fe3+/spermidine/putrescine transport system ATPase subunit
MHQSLSSSVLDSSSNGGEARATSHLAVSDLTVRFGQQLILDHVSFQVRVGERLCLLGPSGCGKTTCLRAIAGFIVPSSGTIVINGNDMATVAPEHRNIGILFQNYALFPHLSVSENVAFGLRMRGLSEPIIRSKVADALNLVRLLSARSKRPAMLSGGEQQRIAFARAIVIEPSLLLLDEPFSNLDARLRQELRAEMLELLDQLNVTTIMVTHDQEEAMGIANRIVVMQRGVIKQIGGPTEIYENPTSEFVARFVGDSNLFEGVARSRLGGASVAIKDLGEFPVDRPVQDGPVRVLIRPEKIRMLPRGSMPARSGNLMRCSGQVERLQYLGYRTEYQIRIGGSRLMVWRMSEGRPAFQPGELVELEWDRSQTLVFEARAEE